MKTSKIPDFPKIKIENYISKLSDKVKIILEKDVISEFIDKSVLNKVSNKLGLLEDTLEEYIKNKRYPLVFLKEINKLIYADIFKIIEKNNPLFFSKWKRVKLPKFITPKLAYFVGYLQGDGSIESNEKRINFSDEYEAQLKQINLICFDLFNIKGVINAKKTTISKKFIYVNEIGSLVLNSYLHNIFEINRGIKTNLKIPSLIKNKKVLKWYIIGLFDADGTLPKNPEKCKQLFIDVTFKDKGFIEQIKDALDTFGIKTLKPYCRIAKSPTSDYISKTWELRIRKKGDIIKFLREIGFYHPNKGKRAKKLLKYLGQ